MPIRLTLIAHAETSTTRLGIFPNRESLDERGRAAAARLAGNLPAGTEALSSPAPAAQDTAVALGLASRVEPALADIDVGAWAGRSVMEIGMQDAEGAAAWIADPNFAGHGGESFAALIERLRIWLASRVAVQGVTIGVTHAAVLRAATIATLGADASAFWRIEAGPLAILSLSSDGRRWILRELRQN